MSSLDTESVINTLKEDFGQIYLGSKEKVDQAFQNIKNSITEYASLDDFKRRFSLYLLKELTLMLKSGEIQHKDFFLDNMRENVLWQPLTKLILAKRVEELKTTKVMKKGKKYDISGLRKTYLGNIIIDKLGFARRSILTDQEYEQLINTIRKLKYEVPVTVEPTETEKFFEK